MPVKGPTTKLTIEHTVPWRDEEAGKTSNKKPTTRIRGRGRAQAVGVEVLETVPCYQ
jgi:hypothetical protein